MNVKTGLWVVHKKKCKNSFGDGFIIIIIIIVTIII